MPLDVRDFTGIQPADRAAVRANRPLVAIWLFCVCGLLLVMIALGGATRLTGSGLSIMEWAPLSGVLPPLSEPAWERLFTLYKEIPQYQILHEGFGLEGFKRIFWLEWVHRLWGRLLGLAFLLPLVWFWSTGRIDRRLRPRLAVIFVLGGLQGAVGWFMVTSGLFPDATAVSPYRLVVHLVLALALYGAVFWTALDVLHPFAPPVAMRLRPGFAATRILVRLTGCLIALTILAGGFVAGTHAGLAYNTFPLMGGRLIPDGYGQLSPFSRNLTENVAAVQFDHRLLATLTAVLALVTVVIGYRRGGASLRLPLLALGVAVAVQYALGVATLLSVVSVDVAVAHQVTAVLALSAVLSAAYATRSRSAGGGP